MIPPSRSACSGSVPGGSHPALFLVRSRSGLTLWSVRCGRALWSVRCLELCLLVHYSKKSESEPTLDRSSCNCAFSMRFYVRDSQ